MYFNIHKISWQIKVLAWIVFFFLYFIIYYKFNAASFVSAVGVIFSNVASIAVVYYFITRIIAPYFFRKNLWLIGVILVIVSFWLFLVINYLGLFFTYKFIPLGNDDVSLYVKKIYNLGFIKVTRPIGIIPNILTILGNLAIPVVAKLVLVIGEKNEKEQNLKKEKLEMELAFLKSQLNPHFLFNTLNNIYSLVATQSPYALSVIEKLSDTLRYTLYDTGQEKVPLKEEIKFLNSYIELAKLRNEFLEVDIENNITENCELTIIPLIPFPFIENAFKYTSRPLNKTEKKHIYISFINKNNVFYFKVKNEKGFYDANAHNNTRGGIGVQNAKNRLDLHYPKKHVLKIKDEKDFYEVSLEIIL
ncbi:MAG: histidine kinase [Chitinophagaceae bacterium]|jgi:sensor histidine kinase YesM|nr:histidine kinase [Chitinophagaceae bacterium]